MATNFTALPILDFALTNDQADKPEFISQLRHALLNVGFLYLKNHTVPQQVTDDFVAYIPRFFDREPSGKVDLIGRIK